MRTQKSCQRVQHNIRNTRGVVPGQCSACIMKIWHIMTYVLSKCTYLLLAIPDVMLHQPPLISAHPSILLTLPLLPSLSPPCVSVTAGRHVSYTPSPDAQPLLAAVACTTPPSLLCAAALDLLLPPTTPCISPPVSWCAGHRRRVVRARAAPPPSSTTPTRTPCHS